LESRHRAAPQRNRSLKHNAGASDSTNADLPHIAELIADGEITVGMLNPVGCVAVATDGHNSLAMLKRRPGETLTRCSGDSTRLSSAHGQKKSTPTRSIPPPHTRSEPAANGEVKSSVNTLQLVRLLRVQPAPRIFCIVWRRLLSTEPKAILLIRGWQRSSRPCQ
jgi:hypothetical protein